MKKFFILFTLILSLFLYSCTNSSTKYSVNINNTNVEESSEYDLITPGKLYDNWIRIDDYHLITIKNNKNLNIKSLGYFNLNNTGPDYYNFEVINYELTTDNNIKYIKIDNNYEIIDRQIIVISFEINDNETIHKFRIGIINRENP